MGGGSTTVDGPKNEETSADVVTGVLRSPGTASVLSTSCWVLSGTPEAGIGLWPLFAPEDSTLRYNTESKLSTLKWRAAAAAAASVKRNCWWGCVVENVSKPSIIMVVDEFSVGHLLVLPPEDKKSKKQKLLSRMSRSSNSKAVESKVSVEARTLAALGGWRSGPNRVADGYGTSITQSDARMLLWSSTVWTRRRRATRKNVRKKEWGK